MASHSDQTKKSNRKRAPMTDTKIRYPLNHTHLEIPIKLWNWKLYYICGWPVVNVCWSVLASSVTVSLHKPWSSDSECLVVLLSLSPFILYCFHLLFWEVPWVLTGGIWWRHPIKCCVFTGCLCLYNVWQCVSAFVPVLWRRKILW